MPARFNTLTYATRLKACGVAAGHADAQANALFHVLASHRRDLDDIYRRAISELGQRFTTGLARLSDDISKVDGRVTAIQEKMEQRFVRDDARFASIDQRFASIDRRFDAIDQRFTELETRIDHRFIASEAALDKRFAVLEANTAARFTLLHWMLGSMLTGMTAIMIRLFV